MRLIIDHLLPVGAQGCGQALMITARVAPRPAHYRAYAALHPGRGDSAVDSLLDSPIGPAPDGSLACWRAGGRAGSPGRRGLDCAQVRSR